MSSPYHTLVSRLSELETKINYVFENKELLTQAFCHRSYTNENPLCPTGHNERLEFLGDAVIGLIAASHVYLERPDVPEGELTHLRARLVEASSCADYLEKLEVAEFILLGRGELRGDGRGRASIWADLFEALIGAIYLDSGYEAARAWFYRHFRKETESVVLRPTRNWKAELQDYSQKTAQQRPDYEVIEESGPDHNRHYVITVSIDGIVVGRGEGKSKKGAQQAAAEAALLQIEEAADGKDEE